MKKVYQTRFGGLDKPLEEQGNCFQACVASILEIPLEDAFDCIPFEEYPKSKLFEKQVWYLEFNKWLAGFGLASIFLEWEPTTPKITTFLGYHIAEFKRTPPKDGMNHAVVIYNGEVVHDPNPQSNVKADGLRGIYLLVPLDISALIDKKKVKDD